LSHQKNVRNIHIFDPFLPLPLNLIYNLAEKVKSPVKCIFIARRTLFSAFLNNNSFVPQSEGQLKCPLSVSAILINMKKAESTTHMYSSRKNGKKHRQRLVIDSIRARHGCCQGSAKRLYLIGKYYIFKQYPLKVPVADLPAKAAVHIYVCRCIYLNKMPPLPNPTYQLPKVINSCEKSHSQ